MTDPFVGAGGAFNPSSLFGPNDGGGVIDIGVMSSCFQDDAGTVPVTATGQVVRSIRAVNRPTFLMVLDPDNLEATYELDPQGFPALKAAPSAETRDWAYYLKGDGGLPLTDWSIVMSALGTYGSGLNIGVGTGWSLFGNSTGDYGEPYEYAGLYTVQPAGDSAEILSTLDEGTQTFPVVENIDGRPYVYSTRSAAGEVDYQVNLEPVIETPNGVAGYPAPVGIKFWISPDDYWYGGVFITRYLSNNENLDTQIWCGNLAGITLVPVAPFNPLDLFNPGDQGGFYNTNDINSLFQTRTGPTVPVTADGQPVQFAVSQNGQFALARAVTAANPGFLYRNGLLEAPVGSAQFASLNSGNVPGFGQITVVMAGVIDTPLPVETNIVAMGFDVDNTTAFGGGGITIILRASPFIRILNWIPPGSSPTASMNIPAAELIAPFVFGYRQDEASPTQYMFFNDTESTPTIEYAPVTAQASGAEYVGFAGGATDPPVRVFTGSAFFINRLLSDTELAQLKTWMRANTPTP
jgi:hypothetical protein